MQIVSSLRLRQAAVLMATAAICLWLGPRPGQAQSLFARHEVTVQFATSGGAPLADAEVKVFAPGEPGHPAVTGRTDKDGKFEFPADRDGFWSAEARHGGEIARVMVRVGAATGAGQEAEPLSPYWVFGALVLLLILAFGLRIARARLLRRPKKPGSPPRTP